MPDMAGGSGVAGEALGLPPGPGGDCGLHQGEGNTFISDCMTDDLNAQEEKGGLLEVGGSFVPSTSAYCIEFRFIWSECTYLSACSEYTWLSLRGLSRVTSIADSCSRNAWMV